jgi:glycosyltransferase involved in cell wall biosynthesis
VSTSSPSARATTSAPAVAATGVAQSPSTAPNVEIVVPAHNEGHVISWTLTRLERFLAEETRYRWKIVVIDNASTDATLATAERAASEVDDIEVRHFPRKGRGGALRSAWSCSRADVVAYMDADLSTGLEALVPLVDAIVEGGADIAIGSRVAPGAQLDRRLGREILSRGYNAVLRAVLKARFRDAQCGFKALRSDAARALLPLVDDEGWFFDTELLVAAQRSGLAIAEIPVRWIDDSDSRVDIVSTVLSDLRGVWRLLWHWKRLRPGELGVLGEAYRSEDRIG